MLKGRVSARVDQNQVALVKLMRKLGLTVLHLREPADLLVCGRSGVTVLVEVKNPEHPQSKRRMTAAELRGCVAWSGGGGLYCVVETAEDVAVLAQAMRSLGGARKLCSEVMVKHLQSYSDAAWQGLSRGGVEKCKALSVLRQN